MPIMSVPFEQIGMDLVGLLTASLGKHCFIFVVTDYDTRYPEAMSLWSTTGTAVAYELATLVTPVGFTRQIMTDQGTVFMGKTVKAQTQLVGVTGPKSNCLSPPNQWASRIL